MASSSESQKAERKRKSKFSTMELQVLVEEVVRVHRQLYGRLSLTVPESTKRKLWIEIGERVNAVGVTHRSLDDLKKRFYDIRGVTKRKLAELHKQAGLTGGGKNRAPPLTDLEELVATTIESASVVGIGDLDSSSRATATGAPSGGGAAATQAPAPAPSASAVAVPSTSVHTQEEDNSSALAEVKKLSILKSIILRDEIETDMPI
ncbi:t-SNARE domain-containing protein 1-like [Lissotriton helveticus]